MSSVCSLPLARRPSRRTGMSLLEVVLALSIFLAAMTALSQIVSIGSRASVESQMLNESVWRCESKMNEVVAGIIPPRSVGATSFDDDINWYWTLNVQPAPSLNLLQIDVTVARRLSDGRVLGEFQMSRWLRDPGSIEASSTSSSTPTSSSGTSATGGQR